MIKPKEQVGLRDSQRVRLIVETLDDDAGVETVPAPSALDLKAQSAPVCLSGKLTE